MSLTSLARYDDAEDEIRDEDHNLVIRPPLIPVETAAVESVRQKKPSPAMMVAPPVPKSLVSYGDDLTDEEDSESDYESDVKPSPSKVSVVNLGLFNPSSVLQVVDMDLDNDDDPPQSSVETVKLPPEPTGRCSKSLQEKIAKMIEKKRSGSMNVNEYVQRKKAFRNPSIYEKLISYIEIDEYGTNFPKKLYDPKIWGPDSYYDALAKTQREYHKEKEKEKLKKTQVEFVTGVKKSSTAQPVVSAADKKTKWDQMVPPSAKVAVVPPPKLPATVQAAIKSNTSIKSNAKS